MFTICSLYVHYMFTICSLYAHYMFTICSLYVHYMFTICLLHVHYIFTMLFLNHFHHFFLQLVPIAEINQHNTTTSNIQPVAYTTSNKREQVCFCMTLST